MYWKLALLSALTVAAAPAAVRSGTSRNANHHSEPPAAGGTSAKVAAGDMPKPAPPPKEVLRFYPKTPPLPDVMIGSTEFMWEYCGQVTAVDRLSITIRAQGEEPKRFWGAGALVGQPVIDRPALGTHELSEVRVGDLVRIMYYTSARRGLFEACLQVHVVRRPGGKIPPRSESGDIHERWQAYQDWEERGVPIPEKYLPVWEKTIGVPYPPVAPPPREAKPKPKA